MVTLFPLFLVVFAVIFRHMTNATGITNFIAGTRAIFNTLSAAMNKLYGMVTTPAPRLIGLFRGFGSQLFIVTYSAMLVPYIHDFPVQLAQE